MAWNRQSEILIGIDPTDPSACVDITGLDFKCRVTRGNAMKDNLCDLTIYNAAESTRNRIMTEGSSVIVKAGYEDEGVGTIFVGQVVQASPQHIGPDWEIKISAACVRQADFSFGTITCAFSFRPGTRLNVVLAEIAQLLGIGFLGDANADIPLPGGYACVGTIKTALDYANAILKSHGRGLHIDLAALVCFRVGNAISEFESVYLDMDSGLLTASYEDDKCKEGRLIAKSQARIQAIRTKAAKATTTKSKTAATQSLGKAKEKQAEIERVKVKLTALLNPKVRPNGIVTVASPQVNGEFIVDLVTFDFDNMAESFGMEIEASK